MSLGILLVALLVGAATWLKRNRLPTERIIPPPDPAESVRAVIVGLREDHPAVLWDALPWPWQQDIRVLLARIDRPTHTRVVTLVAKARDVLRDQRAFLLETPTFQNPQIDRKVADEILNALLETLDALLKSRFSQADMGDIDADWFADVPIGPLIRKVLAPSAGSLTGVEAENVGPQRANQTVVRLTSPQGLSVSLDLVLVGRKWVPAEWVKGWHRMIEELDGRLAEISGNSSRVPQTLATLESHLDRLKAAKTQQRFDSAWQDLITLVLVIDEDDDRAEARENSPGN
jgi:hypothetical protein